MGIPRACPVCGHDPWGGDPPDPARRILGGAFSPCGCMLAARLAEVEAEEAAGRREFEVRELRFTNPEFEAFYSEFDEPGTLAVRPWLPDAAKRARELEARGYYLWTARLLRGFFGPVVGKMGESRAFMHRVEDPRDVPRSSVRAIGSVIEEMEPGWVEASAEARRYADDPRVLAAWTEIPLQARSWRRSTCWPAGAGSSSACHPWETPGRAGHQRPIRRRTNS